MKTKKRNNFKLFLILITSIFSLIIFLSIPVLYNYKSLENKIEKQFFSEFNIELEILGEISRQNFPQPHLIVKKANLGLHQNNSKKKNIEVKDLKILLSYKDILSKSNINIVSAEIKNSNLKFNFEDLKNLREHLYYKINKPIIIKNSKFFYLDKNSDTILISPINDLKYFINDKNNSKDLKIKGNIFDSNFKSSWSKKYDQPNKIVHEIIFKKPDIKYKNLFNLEKNSNFSGLGSINFLDEEIKIRYLKKNKNILLNFPTDDAGLKIKIIANIELNPFYFDASIILIDKSIDFIIENFLYILYNIKSESFGNINGNLHVNIENLDDDLFDNGKINLSINEKSIKFKETYLEIKNIGILKSEFSFEEVDGEILFSSNNIFEIKNKKAFARKFQLNKKILDNINKIFFSLQKNIDSNAVYISNLSTNKNIKKNENNNFHKIRNINEFKTFLRKILTS